MENFEFANAKETNIEAEPEKDKKKQETNIRQTSEQEIKEKLSEDQAREKALLDELKKLEIQDEKYEIFTKDTPVSFFDSVNPRIFEKLATSILNEFEKNPQLKNEYEQIVRDNNQEFLKAKSERFFAKLFKEYLGPFSLFRMGEKKDKKEKYKRFEEFFKNLTPVRSDRKDFPHDEFLSPRKTGKVKSFADADVIVAADNYVYGSIGEMPHFMARGNQYELDRSDMENRGQILMQDIANVMARTNDQIMQRYLGNIFDYENGLKILALYSSMVFETPKEAVAFFKTNNHPNNAQRWEDGFVSYPYNFSNDKKAESDIKSRTIEIVGKMKEIFEKFGLEPPLSLEIRVSDRVGIKK